MRTCALHCGSVVGDIEQHIAFFADSMTAEAVERLRFGPPEDWPRTPGAPKTIIENQEG